MRGRTIEAETLNPSIAFCDDLMQRKAVNFYHAFKNLDSRRFNAVLGVYAFCRFVDDLVDEDQGLSKIEIRCELMTLRSEIERYYIEPDTYAMKSSHFRDAPWYPGFISSLNHFPIEEHALVSQIEGQLSDLDFEDFDSMDQLIRYSENVAGSVGLILMPMILSEEASSQDVLLIKACIDLGVAMQFTNILRDIGEDLSRRNRIYLPKDLLIQFDLKRDSVMSLIETASVSPSFVALWETLAIQAEKLYDNFNQHIMHFDPKCRLALLLASYNYRGILDSVRKEDYNCLTQRCYTSKTMRLRILAMVRKQLKTT